MANDAATIREACRRLNEYGDPTLCAEIDCPFYGEPDGCSHPTGYRTVGNSAAMREALRVIETHSQHLKALEAGGEDWRGFVYAAINVARAALGRPARICDKMDQHKAIYNCRVWLMRHGHKLTSRQEDVMMQTIYWLYDETEEAEVVYEKK